MPLSPGETLGPYVVIAPLGAGGMGEVYKARDTRLDRTVAIKVVRADLVDDPHRVRRFQQEARSAAAFHHPNIAVLHEIGENDGHHFIVMEYVEGQTLSRVIGGRPLPVTQLLDLGVQLAEALEEARSKGVVHRDIKPANIMVTPRGRVKILDFGLAKTAMVPPPDDVTATAVESMTQAGVAMGTIPYMSPEQALGQSADHRSDLFSLGIVLYEMATGKRPFDGPTTMALLNEIINTAPAPASGLNPALPAALDPVLCKALEKDARQRYQTAADLLSDLQKLQRGGESGQSVAPPRPPSQAAANPSRPRTLILAAAGVAAAAGIVWFGFFRHAGGGPVVQPPAGYNLTQVTRDSGLTYQPSISSDGNFVVYASDRATGADLDIWLQHVSGGQPVRLTATPGNEFRPSLSADGRMAAFEADGGQQSGIFVVPALGGSARQVAPAGFDARISPDGRTVAYATGWYMQDSEIRLVSADGGSDRKVSTGLAWAMAPQWTPDGKNLLIWTLAPGKPLDYWAVPASGGVAKKSGAMEQLQGAQSMLVLPFQRDPSPVASVGANGMVVAARSGDGHDLWFVPLSSSRADSPAIRITTGAGAANPSVAANGRIAFARLSVSSGLWRLPLQAASGRVTGELTRVWRENVTVSHPNVSADGKTLVYVSNRGGDADVWVRDLPTGVDRQLTATKFDEYRAVISPDGTRVAFTRPANRGRSMITMPSGGGAETVVCQRCGSVQQWSPDGASILHSGGTQRTRFSMLDVKTGQSRDILWHPEGHIHNGRLSPDGRWVTFTLVKEDSREVYVSSLENAAGRPDTWVRLPVKGLAESSFWSPDGNLVYIHQEDRLWARKLHPTTKAPVGDAFLVQQLPGQRFTAIFSANGLTTDALYFVMNEATSNIWLAEPAVR